jgi:hypothetical protein
MSYKKKKKKKKERKPNLTFKDEEK